MTKRADESGRAGKGQVGHPTGGTQKQKTLFPIPSTEPWILLSSARLKLDKAKYDSIRDCYRVIFDSFLPGRASVPFYTQVSKQLKGTGVEVGPQALARLVSRARLLGIDHFPHPSTRAVRSSSPDATKLQTPVGSVRMPMDAHNAFAEIYRELWPKWRKSREQGKGFFAQAAVRMRVRGYEYTDKQLAMYAHFRRRIGDVNFPRVKGSQDTERMQVAAVERTRALGVMATGLMHEILQPLQVIQSTTEQQKTEIDRGIANHEVMAERLERIAKHAKRINDVVQHVRTIARAGEVRPEAVNLRTAIERALTLFGEQLKSRGIEVDLSGVDANLTQISADPIALERVFINLVTNARDAIEEKKRGSGLIRFSAHEAEASVVSEVTDNGEGIAPDILNRIFEPYFTTKDVGKGTGMGLTEVLNVMIQFGGRITVANNLSGGATFRLEFKKHAAAN
jgi:C4-dicarboxylate-specific signal transduction histidine kinase